MFLASSIIVISKFSVELELDIVELKSGSDSESKFEFEDISEILQVLIYKNQIFKENQLFFSSNIL
jgi:hypothetical protein